MAKRITNITEKDSKSFLTNTLITAGNISDISMQKLLSAFELITYEKNQQIIKQGEVTQYLYFISKGLVRVYYHKKNKEIIDWFAEEGTFIGNLFSHITNKPGFDIYESIEDVTLLRIKYTDLEDLYVRHHDIESLARKIMQKYYITYVERVHNVKGLASEEKYELFIEHYATFMNRIPLRFVANYLGITAETLSRIRAKYNLKLIKSKKALLN